MTTSSLELGDLDIETLAIENAVTVQSLESLSGESIHELAASCSGSLCSCCAYCCCCCCT